MKGPGWRAPSVGTRLSVVIALRPEGAGTRAPVRGARNRGAGHLDHACYIKRSRGAACLCPYLRPQRYAEQVYGRGGESTHARVAPPSSEDLRIQEKLVLPRHSEMLRIGFVPWSASFPLASKGVV